MHIKLAGLFIIASTMFLSFSAAAENSVIVGGITYTCTNTCVITSNPDGSVHIADCCGGRVGIRIPPAPPKEK